MTITAALLVASTSAANLSSYATASITPTGDALVLAAIGLEAPSGTANTPTLTGNGITWTQIATVLVNATTLRRITLFRGSHATPSAGVVTIDCGGQTQESCAWSISEYTGVDLAQGDQGVTQSATGASVGSTASATLSAFGSATNAAVGYGGAQTTTRTLAVEGGHTQLSNQAVGVLKQIVGFLASQDTTPAMTISGAADINWASIGVELAEDAAAPPATGRVQRQDYFRSWAA